MRYKIWDGKEQIYTLVGETLSPEEWKKRHSWANIPGVKAVIGGGTINGTVMMEFDAMVEHYKRAGAVIDEAKMTDEQVLSAIEAFEDTPPAMEVSADERIAAALEFSNLLGMEDE